MAQVSPTKPTYIFCPDCKNKAWTKEEHSTHLIDSTEVDYVIIEGVFVAKEFITSEEESQLLQAADTVQPWVPSQEGRAKQDYGPKVSFLKQKCSLGNFHGFPSFANQLFRRMLYLYPELFSSFVPVEFCILEYDPNRGSYIRPHYDDKWIWGDRLVTVNIASETILRLTKEFNSPPYEIKINMPAKSLLVLFGEARYDWHHSIHKYDIVSRRIAMTWREFSEDFYKDKKQEDFVEQVLKISDREIQVPMKCLL